MNQRHQRSGSVSALFPLSEPQPHSHESELRTLLEKDSEHPILYARYLALKKQPLPLRLIRELPFNQLAEIEAEMKSYAKKLARNTT